MLWIKTLPCGPFGTNAYLVGPEGGAEAVLIDAPPVSYDEVTKAAAAAGRSLAAVVITHPHFDHTMDAAAFSADGVAVYAHPDAIDGIQNPDPLGFVAVPAGGFPKCDEILPLEPSGTLEAAGMAFGVLDVPGHSPGSVALLADGACFVGDLVFRMSVGRTDLPGGNYQVLCASILKNIFTLPEETILYPGHGPETTVGEEKRGNPYVSG